MNTKKTNDNEDIQGFEELIQELDPALLKNNSNANNSKASQKGESLSFIINDQNRLKKLANLLGDRLQQYDKYPQSDQLLQTEIHSLNLTKADLIELLKKDGSIFHQNMKNLINPFFK